MTECCMVLQIYLAFRCKYNFQSNIIDECLARDYSCRYCAQGCDRMAYVFIFFSGIPSDSYDKQRTVCPLQVTIQVHSQRLHYTVRFCKVTFTSKSSTYSFADNLSDYNYLRWKPNWFKHLYSGMLAKRKLFTLLHAAYPICFASNLCMIMWHILANM